ncbi:Phytocyanin domain [Dillenia turbinata]|uniref:Phytocyanin domain n=1 Tax=Dillenia turbinata TaxID=194707 RepID=A0AAN8VWS0_9MAGN
MGRRVMMMLVVAILAMDLITEMSEATTHIVGDMFNYQTGAHDVATVTKANHDACNPTSPIALSTTGPTNITLTSGSHYFICTFGTHCSSGQKLAVNVSTASTSPSPSPSPSPSTPTPTSPSPAPSTATAPSPGTSAPAPATATPPSSKTPSPSPSTSTSPSPSPTSPAGPPSPISPAGTPPSATPPSPAGETPGSTTSPPPPPPSSAPSVAAASGVTFLAIALALVY